MIILSFLSILFIVLTVLKDRRDKTLFFQDPEESDDDN